MKKRVLVLGYSQTGQLSRITDSIISPLIGASEDIEVIKQPIEPSTPFPFPWPFVTFFNNFPDTVYETPIELKPLSIDVNADYDLVILCYTVWFLSPSRPIGTFLNSEAAKTLLRDKPVVTVIGCRNMWLMAQEKVKEKLRNCGAKLIDNIVLTDQADSFASLFATPLWMLSGSKGPFLGGLIPKAGVSEADINNASRFGEVIRNKLIESNTPLQTMLTGLGAVKVDEKVIASEKIAHRSFRIWGKLLLSLGPQSSLPRKAVIFIYFTFLVIMLLTVVPLNALIKKLLAPVTHEHIQAQKTYYAAPSGEATSYLEQQS
ncbi:flavodoxin family protein [Aurantivibrio plasticivorans]